MKFKSEQKFQRWMAGSVLLALALLLAPSALAKKDKSKDQPKAPTARVVAHLPLQGSLPRQMFLQAQGGKQYLYIDQGAKEGYTVVDVSKPSQPTVVKHVDSGKLRVVGNGMAITETPEGEESTSKTVAKSHIATESVKIMDTSDPANPKTVQTFTGVTSILPDNGRNLIYLTNADGLWVVSNPPARVMQPERQKPPCTSESAIQAMPPDCQ